ncbi:tyrosinase family oxidase copper chaperone [Streptomyces alanosinicus]|uniref:Tyrosinase n=1 Tax=Streptomyces alanosinicus TaxID=68171 RepID=A0A918YDM3_9ACTN|nr:tyrosinase family oxidase copper chaperone [Streptomyces alanosinicus]GHD99125.1 tyrosinase [Streptomyces alanosinicus]
MVPGVGGAPAGGRHSVPAADGARPQGRTRRDVTRGLLSSAVAAALAPAVAACGRDEHAPDDGRRANAFDETYRGRRIRGVEVRAAHRAVGGGGGALWEVTIDGRRLHLMRRADGSWLSMVDHYRSYPTPLAAARAAVDELGPDEQLHDLAPGPMGEGPMHTGGGHGVHA